MLSKPLMKCFHAIVVLLAVVPLSAQSNAPKAGPCNDGTHPEYRKTDYWLGDWEVLDGAKKVAAVNITSTANGCALAEHWDGLGGDSRGLMTYSLTGKKWEYFYVSGNGDLLRFVDGHFVGDEFTFVQAVPADGKVHHWSLFKLPTGGLRELSVASSDGGKTWSTEYEFKWSKKK